MEIISLFNPYLLAPILILICILLASYFKNRVIMQPVIAGDVNKSYSDFNPKSYFHFNHFFTGKEVLGNNSYDEICYLKGTSLEAFGLLDNSKVLVNRATKDDISRGDILVLETEAKPNAGKLKGRVFLGTWGDPTEPDCDLIRYEKFSGSVEEYFNRISPQKYGYAEPYVGTIKGFLKTLSCDVNEGRELKVSRPHDPNLIRGKVEYLIEH